MRERVTEYAVFSEFTESVETAVRTNPETAVLGAVVALVVVIGLIALLRWIRRPMGARLRRVLAKSDEIAVLMHPNPDPDAMACAYGVAHLAESYGTPARMYYSGQIRHQENRAFRTVLDLDFVQLEDATELAEDTIVLVDHNRPRGFPGAEGIEPSVVIDHHPGSGAGTSFTDVRVEYGSCSSIVAEYFGELGATVPVDDDEVNGTNDVNGANSENGENGENGDHPLPADELVLTSPVATGLLYGIQADTKHLTKGCTSAEFHASSYLYPAVNEDQLDRIANPQVSWEVLEVKANAIKSRDVRGPFAVSDVGEVTDADTIPQAADELMQLEGVTAVVVFGERNGTIHLSGRSRDDRVHMGRTLETALDSVPMASAGGHARMGGGQVPAEYLAGIGPSGANSDQSMVADDLTERLFDSLTGNV